ncbi:MAG: hypothetical protein IJG17_01015 [Eubacterium sp.]|nr:hypothetical protein [Eubacterium sp.]
MKLKRENNRRKTGKGRIAAVLVLAVLLGAAPAIKTQAVDLVTGPFTVTVKGDTEKFADLENANVVLDFYQVATAEELTGYDAYTFKVTSDFSSIQADLDAVQKKSEDGSLQATDVDKLTQTIAKVKLDGVKEYSATAPKQTPVPGNGTLNSVTTLNSPGLYLIIPRGSDIEGYKHTITKTEGTTTTTTLTTVANGKSIQYVFMPMLVSVPSRGIAPMGSGSFDTEKGTYTYPIFSGNTANTGEWENAIELDIKVGEQDMDTKIRIDKDLVQYETIEDRGDTATFAFTIDAVKDGKNVFSDARSITLSAVDTSDYVEIDHIPVGSLVTVREAYTGGDYKFAGVEAPKAGDAKADDGNRSITFTATAAPDDNSVVLVSFTNTYDDKFKDGGSVTNHIVRNEDGTAGEGSRTYSDNRSRKNNAVISEEFE